MGFRYGLWLGQSNTWICVDLNHLPSCNFNINPFLSQLNQIKDLLPVFCTTNRLLRELNHFINICRRVDLAGQGWARLIYTICSVFLFRVWAELPTKSFHSRTGYYLASFLPPIKSDQFFCTRYKKAWRCCHHHVSCRDWMFRVMCYVRFPLCIVSSR